MVNVWGLIDDVLDKQRLARDEKWPDDEPLLRRQVNVESLLDTHYRRLQVLEQQQAAMGNLTPAHIVTEIDRIKEEIKKLQKN